MSLSPNDQKVWDEHLPEWQAEYQAHLDLQFAEQMLRVRAKREREEGWHAGWQPRGPVTTRRLVARMAGCLGITLVSLAIVTAAVWAAVDACIHLFGFVYGG
jgi:hypothetical protein